MSERKTELDAFIEQEIKEGAGVRFPVKTGMLRRLFTKKARCSDLHPNPEDEFCMPEIGPSYRIISEYKQKFMKDLQYSQYFDNEPVIVERIHPDGYMIINGHHRWAAAMGIGQSMIPVRIVNLMHEADVKKILNNSKHVKRAAIDLDEVVFCADEALLEKPPHFPWNRLYKLRVRRGIPALFHTLAKNGYDIWLYSSDYYSTDYIKGFFHKYQVDVTGVISAIGKRQKSKEGFGGRLEKQIMEKYKTTVHIDMGSVIEIDSETKEFYDRELSCEGGDWAKEVISAIEELEKRKERSA